MFPSAHLPGLTGFVDSATGRDDAGSGDHEWNGDFFHQAKKEVPLVLGKAGEL
jgi:hypothetical protein